MIKPIYYYSVMTGNRGDKAIRKSITDAIHERINVPIAYFNVKYEELTKDRILNQLNKEASALIIAGSGLYTNYPMSSGWYFPCKTELFTKIKVPIFLLGLGCNNNLKNDIFQGNLKPETKESIKLINDIAKISTVRDERTYDILSEIGIHNHEIVLDSACFLKSKQFPKEKKVAINIAQHAPILGRFDGGEKGRIQRQKNLELFSNICKYLNKRKYKILFLAHDALEDSFYNDLQKLSGLSLEYLNTDNISKMLEEYSKCHFCINMKMHSVILAFSCSVPSIHLYYDQKSIEFMNIVPYAIKGTSIFDVNYTWCKRQIDDMIKNYEEYTHFLRTLKQEEQESFDILMDKLCCILKNIN